MLVCPFTVSLCTVAEPYDASSGSGGNISSLFLLATLRGTKAAGVPLSAQNFMYLLVADPVSFCPLNMS